jgi:hypothetical protein
MQSPKPTKLELQRPEYPIGKIPAIVVDQIIATGFPEELVKETGAFLSTSGEVRRYRPKTISPGAESSG